MTTAALVFDSGPGVGLGHQRRLEALAVPLLAAGIGAHLSEAGGPARADLVVVDSYRHRADDNTTFRGTVVAAIDDLERSLDVDVVVDPTPGATGAGSEGSALLLAGSDFALIPALRHASPRPINRVVKRVLVTTGAADTDGTGAAIAQVLVGRLPDVSVSLIIGPWGSGTVPHGVEAVRTPDGLEAELADADLVVTAGGVTMLEALRLGRPVIAIVTASNQRRAVSGAADAGVVMAATASDAAERAAGLAADVDRRLEMAKRAADYVDGRGPERVATVLTRLVLGR